MFEVGKKYKHNIYVEDTMECLYVGEQRSFFRYNRKGKNTEVTIDNQFFSHYEEYKEPKKGTFWVNVYNEGSLVSCGTREHAVAAPRGASKRIACVEVNWVEGQGL